MASSTLSASSDVLDPLDQHHHTSDTTNTSTAVAAAAVATTGSNNNNDDNNAPLQATPTVTIETPSTADLLSFSRRGTLPRRHRQHRESSADIKLKRRISFSQVFKSLTMPSSRRNSLHDVAGTGASTDTLQEVFDDEIYVWNTVTTKNLPKPTVVV